MEHSVLKIPRPVRRRLKNLTQKPTEQNRRTHAILLLWETENCVATVARLLHAARSSVQLWRALYEDFGEQGLVALRRGCSAWKANDEVSAALIELLQPTPGDRAYLRSCWSSELLATIHARVSVLAWQPPCTGQRISGADLRSAIWPISNLRVAVAWI
jgi:putative transposase